MKKPALPKKLFLNPKGFLAISAIACLLSLPVQAANFGHARLDSSNTAGLDIRIPINNLTAADMDALSASAAPAEHWQANGLTPPVDLDSLRFNILKTDKSGASILQVLSDQPYRDSIIDLLLNIKTATGVEPYQVSLIVPPPAQSGLTQQVNADKKDTIGSISANAGKIIHVKRGDTMFAISERNAVDGVTVYQLMMALHRTNPDAFIKSNVNLVKAGANLVMPSQQEMLAISDAEARRQFVAHTNALGSSAAGVSSDTATEAVDNNDSGSVTIADSPPERAADASPVDQVRLGAPTISDTEVAEQHALQDTKLRVSQLEDNVRNLNQALQSQGRAASDIVTDSARAINESFNQLADSITGTGTGADADDISSNGSHIDNNLGGQGNGVGVTAPANGSPVASGLTGSGSSGDAAGASAPPGAGTSAATGNQSGNTAPGINIQTDSAAVQGNGAASGSSAPGDSAPGDSAPGDSASGASASGASALGASASAATGNQSGDTAPGTDVQTGTAAVQDNGAASGSSAPGASASGASASGASTSAATGNQSGDTAPGTDVQVGTAAVQGNGAASGNLVEADTDSNLATASGSASDSPAANNTENESSPTSSTATAATEDAPAVNTASTSADAADSGSGWLTWASEHLLAVIASILALIVLVIVWVLRRLSAGHDNAEPIVTNDMLQQKLDEIDLELDSDKPLNS